MGGMKKHIIPSLLLLVALTPAGGQNKPAYEVDRLPVSSGIFSDIAPVIHADGILFCSNRTNGIVKDNRTCDENRSYDIYYAEKTSDGNFRNPRVFSKDLASIISEGPFCFSPDGKTIYFTRNLEEGKAIRRRNRKNLNGIFLADRQGDRWVNIRPFEYNNEAYTVGHPTISNDGRYLFFSSDMPGGMGKSDIYYCEWIEGRWSQPVNAGATINTPHAEIYLNMHPSGRLYFSSDRPPSRPGPYGGLNIYYSSLLPGEWTTPVMLGEPVNSTSDDFAFTAYPDGMAGYFSSSRRRNDDLYAFKSIIIRRDDCSPQEENSFCYEFYEVNAVIYDTIPFEYEWDFGDGHTAKGARAEHCFDGPGTYIINLNSVNLVTKEIQKNEVTYELVVELIEQPFITGPDTVRVGEAVEFTSLETHLPGWNIEHYVWNFDDDTAGEGERVMKIFQSPGVFQVQLIVSTEPDRGEQAREGCVTKSVVVVRNR
jgi:hypothetical protein